MAHFKFYLRIAAIICAAMLSGCAGGLPEPPCPENNDSESVTLFIESVGLSSDYRSGAYDGNVFEAGMSFGLTITGQDNIPLNNDCLNVKATLGENGKWTLDREIKIKKGQNVWVRAYYPYTSLTDGTTVSPNPDEDVMVSNLCLPSGTGGLNMVFSHIYAELKYEILHDESYKGTATVGGISLINGIKHINGIATNETASGLATLSNLQLPATDTPFSPTWNTAKEISDSYASGNHTIPIGGKHIRSAFVAPLDNSSNKEQVHMSINVDGQIYSLKSWFPTWKAGYRYTYIIHLAQNPVTGEVTITVEDGGITIQTWIPGESEEITIE